MIFAPSWLNCNFWMEQTSRPTFWSTSRWLRFGDETESRILENFHLLQQIRSRVRETDIRDISRNESALEETFKRQVQCVSCHKETQIQKRRCQVNSRSRSFRCACWGRVELDLCIRFMHFVGAVVYSVNFCHILEISVFNCIVLYQSRIFYNIHASINLSI